MKVKLFFFSSICLFSSILFCTIWKVNQDGSGDFTTVQQGINAAVNTDTVLVFPGVYYENLEILEKSITIGSLYLTTGDEFYIPYTILDGNHESCVIRINYVPSSPDLTISGFTIQNGIGYRYSGDDDRTGGGLYAMNSDFTINCCIFKNNEANVAGGGFYIKNSNSVISKCIIQNNVSEGAGGIAIVNSFLSLSGSTIRFNRSDGASGGILIGSNSNVNFDNNLLNNIYMNFSPVGNDIFISCNCPFQEIIVDTFTVFAPDDDNYLIYPSSDGMGFPLPDRYSIDIQNGYVEQVDQDVYVATYGNDNNSGLSPAEPLQTIAYALVKINADSLEQRSIHILDGVYSESLNNQIFPIQIKSYVDIAGFSINNTILDGEDHYGFFVGNSGQKNYCIRNLTLLHNNSVNIELNGNTNVSFKQLLFDDGYCESIYANISDITMENITQMNTTGGKIYLNAGHTTGSINIVSSKMINNYGNTPIYCTNASNPGLVANFNIMNSEVSDNMEIGHEWLPRTCAIKVDCGSKLNLINSTIGNNESLDTGAAVQISGESEGDISNSIIYDNIPYNLCLNGSEGPIVLNARNSVIGGGITGLLNMGTNVINWDHLTMLDEDPLWLGSGYEFPYALSVNSPCIDTGTLELPYGVELPAYDLAGNPRVMGTNIDMGAYEYPGNAAPIYLEVNNEILCWQIPAGFSPDSYNVYLDEELQVNLPATQMEYVLQNLIVGESYKAGVSAIYAGEETAIIPKYFTFNPVGAVDSIIIHDDGIKLTNYPNPFNPSTTISFNVPQSSAFAILEIFNIKGQKVKTLVKAQLASGNYNISWNGKDSNNKRVSSGEYFAKLRLRPDSSGKSDGGEVEVQKMLFLK